jgi:hypothetical protein
LERITGLGVSTCKFNISELSPMKKLAWFVAAAALTIGAAYAEETTVIKKDSGPSAVIEHRSDPTVIEHKSVTTTGTVGCSTTTKQKTDDFGDTKTKQKTEC